MNPESEYNRKRLTKFLCQELLYEMVTHNLDGAREKEVTDYLETCRESQREFDNLNKGLRYTLTAAQVRISPALHHALENFEPQWQKQLRAWTLSSTQKGWRMLPYIFGVLVIGVGLLVTKPWVQKASEDVMLAEHLRKEPDMMPDQPPAPPAPPVETAPQAKAELPAEEAAPPTPPAAASPGYLPDVMETVARVWLPAVRTFKPDIAVRPVESQTPPASATENDKKMEAAAVESAPKDTEEAMGRGFLHRATMDVQDFQNSWPAIRDKIVALGGKVAGNVELGWLRKPTEAYFHFTLPESNMNELEIFLGTFSPVQFSKDRHPRVMPEGQIRIIMSVKDGMTQNESPSETP